MSQLSCPHCGAVNLAAGAFCESCGKAMPGGSSRGPRTVEGGAVASTGAGRDLQAAELLKKCRAASGILFAVAALMTLGAFLIPWMIDNEVDKYKRQGMSVDMSKVDEIKRTALIVQIGLAVTFVAMGFWARSSPFPAAIVGLVALISVWFISAISDPSSIAQGIIIKIFIVAALVKAIQAGAQHRQLMQDQAQGR